MLYTQMLFALTFDKVIFGHSPDVMSIAGSTLILGSALYVATMVSTGRRAAQEEEEGGARRSARDGDDVESAQSLLPAAAAAAGASDGRGSEDLDRVP